ncbi:MAG: chorismate lyase [Synechococcaceae cyanobacterium]|nr:chorismate lyase [Synechococcaceae cyanobacterium]
MLPSPRALWQSPLADVLAATAGHQLSGAWKLMLLGDGGPTRHLQLLSGHPVTVEVIAMAPQPGPAPGDPDEVRELEPPLLRRQVWLVCAGETLAWAESWWNQHQAEVHLRNRRQPIWTSLTAGRAELFREVDGLGQVEAAWLGQRFGHPGPYWSRHYRFFRGGRELTVIREVFSPALQRWLGEPRADAIPATHNSLSF